MPVGCVAVCGVEVVGAEAETLEIARRATCSRCPSDQMQRGPPVPRWPSSHHTLPRGQSSLPNENAVGSGNPPGRNGSNAGSSAGNGSGSGSAPLSTSTSEYRYMPVPAGMR